MSGNTAGFRGGGIVTNSQVTGNEAAEGGGIYFKIYPQGGSVTLTDSTVADNEPDNCAGDPVDGCTG